MPTASITYNGYGFHLAGKFQYGRAVKYEPDVPGGIARRTLTTITVKETFTEPGFADNQARYATLKAALAVTEANLTILDERGTQLVNMMARVETSTMPEQWGQTMLEVSVVFVGREEIATASPNGAVFTPTQAGSVIPVPVSLPNVSSWKEDIRTERYANHLPNRRESICTITAAGKIYSVPTQTESARRAYLDAQKALIEGCNDTPNGTLAFNGEFSQLVMAQRFTADIHESDYLEWSVEFFWQKFPEGTYAEAEYTVGTKQEIEKGELITTVKGKIRADSAASAAAKAAAIQAGYAAAGALEIIDSEVQQVDGSDGVGFIELSFEYQWRAEGTAGLTYKLTITVKEDLASGMQVTTYAGTVTGGSTAAALAQAVALGTPGGAGSGSPGCAVLQISSSEAVETISLGGAAPLLVQVTFSYEYQTNGGWTFAEVTSDNDQEYFGACAQSVSGFVVATDKATAQGIARGFAPTTAGLVQRTQKETFEDHINGTKDLFIKMSFAYTYSVPHGLSTIAYKVQTSIDYKTRETVTTATGTAYGPNEAPADTLISALVAGIAGFNSGWKLKDERDSSFEVNGSVSVFLSRSFVVSCGVPLANTGDDILEAQWSIHQVTPVNEAHLTRIPYGVPYVQTGVGYGIGVVTITGSVTAVTRATALAWGQQKRGMASAGGGYEKAPSEKMDTDYYPMSGTSIRVYRFEFTYSAEFASLAGFA